MKKKALIFSVVALTALMTSCTLTDRKANVNKTDVAYGTSAFAQSQSTTLESGLVILCSSFRSGNKVLFYPELCGMGDIEKQDRLNALILDDAKQIFSLFSEKVICITVDFETEMESGEKLRVKYSGQGYTSNDDEESFVFREILIDIQNEKITAQ